MKFIVGYENCRVPEAEIQRYERLEKEQEERKRKQVRRLHGSLKEL